MTTPCQSAGLPDWWFPGSKDTVDITTTETTRLAKRLCRTCPVRVPCYIGAKERGEPWGIWGGVDFLEQRRRARKEGAA